MFGAVQWALNARAVALQLAERLVNRTEGNTWGRSPERMPLVNSTSSARTGIVGFVGDARRADAYATYVSQSGLRSQSQCGVF